MTPIRHLLAVTCSLFLVGCGSIDGKRYLDTGAPFDLFQFFEGDVKAWGIVQGRDGNVLQRFDVDIIGTVSGNTLTLDETFTYSLGDGIEKRFWTINDTGNGTYVGTAGDIQGAASGQTYGNAFFWAYQMDLPVGDSEYRVKFKDWMWAFDKNRIINRSYIKKFGITFAEVTLFMEKQRGPAVNSQ